MSKQPRLSVFRIGYLYFRNKTKVKKRICVVNGGKMSEEDYHRCIAIVNQCKQSK